MNTIQLRRRRTIALVALLTGTIALGACGTKVAADEMAPAPAHVQQVSEPATGGGGGGGGGAGTRIRYFL